MRGIFEAVWQVGGGITTVMGDVAMAAHAGLNWGEYLLSKRKPLRRLRALTAVCCFGRACKSLLFFVGVSDALELVSSSIAGGHTED